MKTYLKLLRVKHYVKNILVLAPLVGSGRFFEKDLLFRVLLAFAAFCLMSSFIYIVNDIRDADKDRQHPTKKNRPIASGAVPVRTALIIAGVALALSLTANFLVFRLPSTLALLLYLGLNIGYSMGLKNIPIVDVSILVAGFLIRILYGAVVSTIPISNWLFLSVMALSFYMGLAKRRNEMATNGSNGRRVLAFYTHAFLDKNMYMFLTLGIVFYALWSTSESTMRMHNSSALVYTVPLVILIAMKYSLNIEGDSDADPVEVLLHDKILLLGSVLYVLVMFLILYANTGSMPG